MPATRLMTGYGWIRPPGTIVKDLNAGTQAEIYRRVRDYVDRNIEAVGATRIASHANLASQPLHGETRIFLDSRGRIICSNNSIAY